MKNEKRQKLNHVSVGLEFDNFNVIENTGFARGECKVAYAGKNRNYSDISKDAFEKAEKSLYGIPVVGNWLGDNFGGHDVIIETKGNTVSFKDATIPFGFVPQDANPRWESVEDENGNTKNYYTCDVVLWYERYREQVQFIIDNGARQSMEIMVTDGEWDDDWDYFNISDYYYSALCLLGKDENDTANDVEPCFEGAEVTVNNFNYNEKFSKVIDEMKSAFKGGENVGEKKTKKLEDTKKPEIEETNMSNEEAKAEERKEVEETEKVNTYELEFKEMTRKYDKLSEEYDTLKTQFDELTVEKETLQKYKDEKESEILEGKKNEVIKDYSLLLSEDELSVAIQDKDNMSYADLEVSLSKAFAQKSLEEVKAKNTSKKDTEIVFEVKNNKQTKEKSKFAI